MIDLKSRLISNFVYTFGVIFLLIIAYKGLSNTIDSADPDPAQYKCQPSDGRHDPSWRDRSRPQGGVRLIHLTNSGEFIDRCELTEVLYDLSCDQPAGPYPGNNGCRQDLAHLPKLTLLYIHGWKHDGSPDDENLVEFRKLVDELADRNRDKKNVLGVYVTWHADVKWLPYFSKNLSFWDKKSVADNISRAGAVTGIVGSIASLSNSARGKGDQFIAIGHSFGARILFSATSQSIIYETNNAHPGIARGTFKKVRASADTVILLNPAFEAAQYSFIDGFRRGPSGSSFTKETCHNGNVENRNEEKFAADQKPVMITISSSGDYATRFAAPLGAIVTLDLGKRQRITLGNYCEFATHELRKVGNGAGDCEDPGSNSLTNTFKAEGLCLIRKSDVDRYQPNNPFIVAHTTSDIIKDHNDIWNNTFSKWLIAYIKAIEEPASPAPAR